MNPVGCLSNAASALAKVRFAGKATHPWMISVAPTEHEEYLVSDE